MFLQILCLIWTEKHGSERVSLISNFLAFPSLAQNSVTPVEVRTLQVLTRATKSAIPSSHSLPTFLCSVWSMLDILKRRYWEVQPCPTTCSYLGCWDVGFWSEMWSLRSSEAWHQLLVFGFVVFGLCLIWHDVYMIKIVWVHCAHLFDMSSLPRDRIFRPRWFVGN